MARPDSSQLPPWESLPVGRLEPWTADHAGAVHSLLAHLRAREGQTYAARRALAEQAAALPLYGDAQIQLLVDATGRLLLRPVTRDGLTGEVLAGTEARGPRLLWLNFAWRESVTSLPASFSALRLVLE